MYQRAKATRVSNRHAEQHQHTRPHWCGGRRRDRRARAGFEIDHSEPQARVWRSRGRPGPTAPGTPVGPQANKQEDHQSGGTGGPGCGGRGRRQGLAGLRDDAPSHTSATRRRRCGDRRMACGAWPRCRWVAAGPGRASRSTTPSRRLACGDLAGGRALRRPEHQQHHVVEMGGIEPPSQGIAKGAGISRPLARVPSLIHEGHLDATH